MESEENNDEVFVAYPFINANLVVAYDKWKILVWSYVSSDDWALGLLWATLTVPLENMEAQKVVSAFKCVGRYLQFKLTTLRSLSSLSLFIVYKFIP